MMIADRTLIDDAADAVYHHVVQEAAALESSRTGRTLDPTFFEFDCEGILDLLNLCRRDANALAALGRTLEGVMANCSHSPDWFAGKAAIAVAAEWLNSSRSHLEEVMSRVPASPATKKAVQKALAEGRQEAIDMQQAGPLDLLEELTRRADFPILGLWQLVLLILAFVRVPELWARWKQAAGASAG